MTDAVGNASDKLTKTSEDLEDDGLDARVVEEDPYATSAIFVSTDDTFATASQRETSEKDLNSPDSNDSGIQADTQIFQHQEDDLELYAEVKKPKHKVVLNTTEDHHKPEEFVERTNEQQNIITSSKADDVVPVMRETKLDDPYAMVEFESSAEENEESTYAMIHQKTKVLRIKEQKDDDDEVSGHNISGDNHCHANGSDGKDDDENSSDSSDLPEGWQRHEDEQGSYYWHIKSGITQREPPSPELQTLPAARKFTAKTINQTNGDNKVKVKTKKDVHRLQVVADVIVKPSRLNGSATKCQDSSQNGFLVRCLGTLPLAEEELSDDRSGRAINQCISSLSHRPGIFPNGRLQGRNLYLEFSGDAILLIDVKTSSVIRSESVKSVRVWGVGKEKDSRDFAYVARDPASDKHLCWVFKCERTGHEVAYAIRSVCLRILKENENFSEKKYFSPRLNESGGNYHACESRVSKEPQKNQSKKAWNDQSKTNWSDQSKKTWNDQSKTNWNDQSKHWNDCAVFPVPMSESKKVIKCHYLGMLKVPKPLGMRILNDAIEMIYAGVPSSKWVAASIEVAPSAVTVYDRGSANSVILECRIRFLTFLGIGINNCRLGAFIMHSAQDEFFAHVFHCIPDAGLYCRTIKAACKLRYQKCLDAQTQKDRERGKFSRQTSTGSFQPLQGLKESLQKGVSNLFGSNGKNQQQKG